MDVGVRELKAKLSEMLKAAGAGQLITVTDRGRPIAVLGPPLGTVDLDAAVAEGWLTRASTTGLGATRTFEPRMPTLDALAEDRGE